MPAGLSPPPAAEVAPPAPDLMLGPGRRYWKDRLVRQVLFATAFSSVAVTTGIVAILLFDSIPFFHNVSLYRFLTDTLWTPTFEKPHFGIISLVLGTVVTT